MRHGARRQSVCVSGVHVNEERVARRTAAVDVLPLDADPENLFGTFFLTS